MTTTATLTTRIRKLLFMLSLVPLLSGADQQPPRTNIRAPPGKQAESRIINGVDATKGRYPHLVDLDTADGQHACMGALIAPEWVLTAAHCAHVVEVANIGRDFHDERTSESLETFNIIRKVKHPQYNDFNLNFDFLLLKLDGQSQQKPIRINEDSQYPSLTQEVFVAGFGDTNAGKDLRLPNALQEVYVKVVSNDACSRVKTWGGLTLQGMIGDAELCAFRRSHDACQGDSGAPLIVKGNSPSEDVQVGVVSWGLGCGSAYIPGIYARVSQEFPWIRQHICENSKKPPSYFKCAQLDDRSSQVVSTNTQSNARPVSDNTILMKIAIDFDDNAGDNGYFLEKIDNLSVTPVSKILPGSFAGEKSYSNYFLLERNELYSFLFFDTEKDGLSSGSVKLYLKDNNSRDTLIKSYAAGSFTAGVRHMFRANMDTPDVDFRNTPKFDGDNYLTVQISFDTFPEEIGFEMKMDGERIVYNPPRFFYWYASKTYKKRIQIPDSFHEYEITISDIFGDGFSGANGAGYSLWEGDPKTGRLLIQGSFTYGYSKTWRITTCDLSIGCNDETAAAYSNAGSAVPDSVFTLPPVSNQRSVDLTLTNSTAFSVIQRNVSNFDGLFAKSPGEESEPDEPTPVRTDFSSAKSTRHTLMSCLLLFLWIIVAMFIS